MIFLFKKTRLFVFLMIPLWIFGVVLARLTVFEDANLLSLLLIAFVGAYVLYMFATVQANRMHRSFNEILSNDCDPERYLLLYEEVRAEGKKHKSTVFLTESSYATGAYLAGRAEEAREIVRQLIAHPNFARQRIMDRADAFVDEGIYSVALQDIESAEAAIQRAEEILCAMAIGSSDYNRLFREIAKLKHRMNIARGNYDEALEYFTDTSREYTVPYTKVNRMNTLAQIYRGKGETEKLRKCLLYIAENGGTLKIAEDARAELLTLPEEAVHGAEDAETEEM